MLPHEAPRSSLVVTKRGPTAYPGRNVPVQRIQMPCSHSTSLGYDVFHAGLYRERLLLHRAGWTTAQLRLHGIGYSCTASLCLLPPW